MKRRRLKISLPGTMAIVLPVLLALLAALQYRWTGQLSRAERDRARAGLQAAVNRLGEDLDRELTRAFLYFQADPTASDLETGLVERYRRWAASAPFPELVGDIFLAWHGESGDVQLSRLDQELGRFGPSEWPETLGAIRQRLGDRMLEAESRRDDPPPRRRGGPPFGPPLIPLAKDLPALLIPHAEVPIATRSSQGSADRPSYSTKLSRRPRAGAWIETWSLVIIWLDLEAITERVLPELVERHLVSDGGPKYQVVVLSRDDPPRVIYRHGAASDDAVTLSGDAGTDLFGLLGAKKTRTLAADLGLIPGDVRSERGRRPAFLSPPRDHNRALRGFPRRTNGESPFGHDDGGRWRLVAVHPAGSLEAAVAAMRRRNLTISLGILVLLGGSALLLVVSTRRAQRLAHQQMEFVAGVTHELLTPLAAMRSAGQNLADGVVEDRVQVRRYGTLIDDEGRRLSDMVEQVLAFAGMQAERRSYRLQPVAIAEVIASALAGCRPDLEAKGFEVDLEVPAQLPEVMADTAALRRALGNVIGNAIKYAASGAWIGVRAQPSTGPEGPEVSILIEDRGPGIAAADLPHLFEPFFRGHQVAASPVPGSGLGLSLVNHIVAGHGGRVDVEMPKAGGSRFTLHLPAAPEGADETQV
ncbi:MAG: HAMP domain-containing histidine kinase [bacterium]|nr:HAMP domain-containing histidine kinase [bacterium]